MKSLRKQETALSHGCSAPEDRVAPADQDRIDAEQELDVWWGAHSSRALVPSLVLSILLSSMVGLIAFLVWKWYDLPPLAVRYTAYTLIALIGLVQAWRWAYCVLTRTYRITTRRLYIEKSFRRVPFLAFNLEHVTDVHVEQSALQRRLKVGRLRIAIESRPTPIFLKGMYQPGEHAIEIRRLAQEARARHHSASSDGSTKS